jgi:potassium efflux system protein
MLKLTLSLCLAAFLALPALAQTNAALTNAAAATPPTVGLADVATKAQADTTTLKSYQAGLDPDAVAQAAHEGLPALATKIDERLAADARFTDSSPSLSNLQMARSSWQSVSDALDESQKNLTARVVELNGKLGDLGVMKQAWDSALKDANAKGSNAPQETVQRIQQIESLIADTKKALETDQGQLYSLQNKVAAQAGRARTGLDAINGQLAVMEAETLKLTHPPLWNPESLHPQLAGTAGHEKLSPTELVQEVGTYLGAHVSAMLIHLLLFAILLAACYWIRRVIREGAKQEPAMAEAERVFDVPLATALLLALVASNWLYPPVEAPRLLYAMIGAVAMAPAVVIIRRLIKPQLFPLLYATVATYFLDQVRYVATPAGVFSRFVLLAELIAACVFILLALRSKHLACAGDREMTHERVIRTFLHVAFFVFIVAGFANVLGYVPLSFRLGDGMLNSSYLAIIVFAAVRILDALTLAVMSLRPVSGFGMVRRHHDLVYEKVVTIVRWIAYATWFVAALQMFSLRDPLWQEANTFLWTRHDGPGSFKDIQLGAVLAFPFVVWASFALSRFVQFVLEEDVYPKVDLPRGVSYAVSTMVHYAILVVGFFIALSAMNINLSSYAVLAGAFGVGLGFGLQNIMNNFISGLILLFERPIKVGDTVQIDANTVGRVERIGIRASVILLGNGSELIMPNGNLISNPVTNWTLSNCERLIEIPVNIAPKSDAGRALNLLVEAAKAHSSVLKNPPPQAVVVTLAAAAISLKLRCWIDTDDDWMKETSDLTLTIQAALAKADIALA